MGIRRPCSALLLAVLLGGSGGGFAQAAPAFSDFPAARASGKTVKAIDLASDPRARRFRTRLKPSVGRKADFAGHYVVVTWGCGTSCQAVALVDVDGGKVTFAPFSTSLGAEYRPDSTLFIDSPEKAILDYYGGAVPPYPSFKTRYFHWDEKARTFRAVGDRKVSSLRDSGGARRRCPRDRETKCSLHAPMLQTMPAPAHGVPAC